MSDHADTIRRELDYIRMSVAIFAPHGFDSARPAEYALADDLRSSLDRLRPAFDSFEAERQQAIDRAEEAEKDRDYFNRRLGDFAAVAETDRVRCEQAIDALREIDTSAQLPSRIRDDAERAEWWKHIASKRREIARAALLNLGEH